MLHPRSVELTPDDLDLLERAYELRLADDQWVKLLRLTQRIRLSLTREHFWACPWCGCTDVQALDWVGCNTDTAYGEGLDEHEPYWCPSCDSRLDGPLAKVAAPRRTEECSAGADSDDPPRPLHLPDCRCSPCGHDRPETEPQPDDSTEDQPHEL